MNSKTHSSRRSRWLANYPATRHFLKLLAFSLVALVILYFVVTSSAFLKGVVLPRVAKSVNSTIAVEKLSVSPFSQVHLTKLRLTPAGEDQPLLEAEEVLLRYNLFAILRGNYVVNEARLVRPVVNLVHRSDGKANYDPLLADAGKSSPASSQATTRARIRQVSVQDGAVRFARSGPGGSSQASALTKLQLTVENIANEGTGKIEFSADLAQLNSGPATDPSSNGGLIAQTSGGLKIEFDKNLLPANARGEAKLAVTTAQGFLADLADVRASLALDVRTNEVRQVLFQVLRRDQPLGQVSVSGPIDLTRPEARLRVELKAIDRNVLNLAGAAFGLDFGETSVSGSHLIDVSRRGQLITAKGSLNVAKFSVKQGDLATPPINLDLSYQASASLEEKTFKSQEFQLTATQAGAPIFTAALRRALSINWGTAGAAGDSTMGVTVTNLNLANWRLLLPTNVVSGVVNLNTEILFADEGRRLSGDVTGLVRDLTLKYGDYGINQAVADLRTRVTLTEYRSVLLENFTLRVQEKDRQLVTANGGASFDRITEDTTLQLNANADLPVLLTKVTVPDFEASSGALTMGLLANRDKGQTKATLNVSLGQFSGRYGDYVFKDFSTRLEVDGETLGEEVNLRRLTVNARQGAADGGSLDLSGKYHLTRHEGEFRLVLANVNQNALAPVVNPLLAPLTLTSVAVDADGTLRYVEQGRSTVSLRAGILKLRVADPQKRVPGEPMDFRLDLDAGARGSQFELTRALISLPPTARATNQVELSGRFDLSTNQPAASTLKLTADSLDFTPLYDLYVSTPAATGTATPAPAEPEVEPAPISLPVREMSAEASVNRMFLRALAITNFQARMGITNDVVSVSPVNFTLNGAPVGASSRVDLSRAGYNYDLGFRASGVPLGPIATTLEYDRAGEVKGSLNATTEIKGAGITGPNLQKHLAGQFDFTTTNLSLALGNVRSKLVTTTINTIVAIPDLIRNPAGAVGNLLGQLTGSARLTGGWVDEVTKAPIDTISLRGRIGSGKVELADVRVGSPAFRAAARGEIALQPILTNSTVNIPVSLALRRELAAKVGITDAPTGGDTNFVALPDFLTLRGTVGEPKSDVKTSALIALTAKAGAGLLGNTGNAALDQAAGILGNLGSALTGQSPAAGGTNTPAGARTNQPAPFNPLDLLRTPPRRN